MRWIGNGICLKDYQELGFLDGYRFELIALLNLVHHILAAGDLPEHGVLAIEPIGDDVGDEELAAVGIGSGVGHGEGADFMLIRIAPGLVLKFIAGSAAAGAGGIAALDHEVGDHAMKHGAVVKAFAREEDEIVDSLGGV